MTKDRFVTPTRSNRATPAESRFPKGARILRTREYREVYDEGFRISGPHFAAFCLARPSAGEPRPGARLGITAPRALGNAVVRNRIKRRLREIFRLRQGELGPRWDIVLNPRKRAAEAPFETLWAEFGQVIAKCGN